MSLFSEAFKGQLSTLVDVIDDPTFLWLLLQDKDVLTSHQIEECQSRPTSYERIGRMLELLQKRPDENFPDFCEALIASGQKHVVRKYFASFYAVAPDTPSNRPDKTTSDVLADDRQTGTRATRRMRSQFHRTSKSVGEDDMQLMTSEHQKLLTMNRSDLVENISLGNLLNTLMSRGVLTTRDTSCIKEQPNSFVRAEQFLDIIARKPDSSFKEFVQALYDTEQPHLAYLLSRYSKHNCKQSVQ